jgi:ABC-type sugar transport system, permease component
VRKRLFVNRLSLKSLLAFLLIVIHMAPFYILLSTALKLRTDRSSRWLFPSEMAFENFATAFTKGKMSLAMSNTFIIMLLSVFLIVLLGAMSAYPLARVHSKTNKRASSLILAVMMVPPLSVLVPLYKMMAAIGGINTYWGIILLSTTYNLPISIFMYTNFIHTIPKSLDEAATIDGCSRLSVFFRIILPSLKPVTASVVILTSVYIWNDYAFQLYFLQKSQMRTVTLAIKSFFTENAGNLNAGAAAALIAISVPVLVYLFLQKYFVQGMVDSAVK